MVGIVIITHADLGKGLKNAVELIAGKQQQLETVGLFHGDGIHEFEETVRAAVTGVDEGEGVIVMVDFLGGTPSNTALRVMQDMGFKCLAGVNFPMLLETVMGRAAYGLDEIFDIALSTGRDSIMDLANVLNECSNENDEEF